MTFSPELVAARWYSGNLGKEDLPKLAQDALEAGFDGKSLRRIAALGLNDLEDIDRFIEGALKEMGAPRLTKRVALLRLVEQSFEQAIASLQNPYESAREALGMLYAGIPGEFPDIMYQIEDSAEMIELYPEDRKKWEGNILCHMKEFLRQSRHSIT